MGGKDTFKLTSIPTEVKEPQTTKKVRVARDSKPSVDIEKLKELHAARQERANEVKRLTMDNIKKMEEEEERKREAVMKKIDAKARRIEEKNAITDTLAEYAKNVRNMRLGANGARRTYVDRIVYQYEANPGPCYDPDRLRDRLDAPVSKISDGNAKGEIEWCEYRSKNQPGPGKYSDVNFKLPKGGRLPPNGDKAKKSKTYIEWEELRASKIPGPSDTGTITKKQMLGGDILGGEFPKFTPKGLVESVVYNKKHVPGVGEYKVSTEISEGRAVPISHASAKSDVEWAMDRSSKVPGPGEYSTKNTGIGGTLVNSGQGRSMPSVHMCRAEKKTFTDNVMRLAKQTPGPGAYMGHNTPSREQELRNLKKAALQQIKEQSEPPRSKSALT